MKKIIFLILALTTFSSCKLPQQKIVNKERIKAEKLDNQRIKSQIVSILEKNKISKGSSIKFVLDGIYSKTFHKNEKVLAFYKASTQDAIAVSELYKNYAIYSGIDHLVIKMNPAQTYLKNSLLENGYYKFVGTKIIGNNELPVFEELNELNKYKISDVISAFDVCEGVICARRTHEKK